MNNSYIQSANFSYQRSIIEAEALLQRSVTDHAPALYHVKSGGKRMRMQVCLEACQALNVGQQDAVALAVSIELLHNASLVHDDLQDRDETRRGVATVWAKYGQNIAICTGDFLLTKAFGTLASHLKDAPLANLITQMQHAVSETIVGQCNDLDTDKVKTAEQYEVIAAQKSGPLIALPLILPLIAAGKGSTVQSAKNAISLFAVAYQIMDDIGDWKTDEHKNHLNFVNILKAQVGLEQALTVARDRASYLLRRCEKELNTLPQNCAAGITQAATTMHAKLKMQNHE